MGYYEFDETKSRSIAYGFWAASEGRADNPADDKAFNMIMADVENDEYRAVFEEYYHIGHYEQHKIRKNDNTVFFADIKYAHLRKLIDEARNLGQIAAFSFICPDFACNDPRFSVLTENLDPTWKTLLTYEWSYGYDEGLATLNDGKVEGYKSSVKLTAEIRSFKSIRDKQRESIAISQSKKPID